MDIRPLDREDLRQVADLFELVWRSGRRAAPDGLVRHFADCFLDHPWADPELPSLVATDPGGAVVGFIGSHARRFTFEDRAIRARFAGHLVVDPAGRGSGTGLFLMGEWLRGPQDLSAADTAGPFARRAWFRLGGSVRDLQSIQWLRPLRPARFALELGAPPWVRRPLRPLGRLADLGAGRLHPFRVEGGATSMAAEPLTAGALLEQIEALPRRVRVKPAYDQEFLSWLLESAGRVTALGELTGELVRSRGGTALGWYLYYRNPGISTVVQLAAPGGKAAPVLDRLFADAHRAGSAGLRGRLEPGLADALAGRGCVLRDAADCLVRAGDPELERALAAGEGFLSRLESDYWTGADHLRRFAQDG